MWLLTYQWILHPQTQSTMDRRILKRIESTGHTAVSVTDISYSLSCVQDQCQGPSILLWNGGTSACSLWLSGTLTHPWIAYSQKRLHECYGDSCVCLGIMTRETSIHMVAENQNSGAHTCMTSTLSTKLSPQHPFYFFETRSPISKANFKLML